MNNAFRTGMLAGFRIFESPRSYVDDVADDLEALGRSLAKPVEGLTDDELVRAVRQAEEIREASRERSGRVLAELHRRGLSWPAIARLTGLRQTTAYDWAQPYLSAWEPE